MARLIHDGDAAPRYDVVALESYVGGNVFDFITLGRRVREIGSLQDALCGPPADGDNVMFILSNRLGREAASLIRNRCPSAIEVARPGGGPTAGGIMVSTSELSGGCACGSRDLNRRLLARYFSGPNFDGELIMERIEEFPYRWLTTTDANRFRSVEWTGSLTISAAQDYDFVFVTPHADASLRLGSEVALDQSVDDGVISARLAATAYPLRIGCQPRIHGGCSLLWNEPGMGTTAIPLDQLRPLS